MRSGASSNLVLSSLVFEYGCDAMVLLDSELTVRALNPAAQALLGWRNEEVAGNLTCQAALGCRTERGRAGTELPIPGACLCERIVALHRAVESVTLRLCPQGRRVIAVSASGSPLPVDHLGGAVLVLRLNDTAEAALANGELQAGDLRMNLARHQVCVGGATVHLTPLEFGLLRHLLTHCGCVVSHHELLERVWRYQGSDDRDLVKSHIGSLRHRLRDAGMHGAQIRNIYGVGYMLTCDEEGDAPPAPTTP